MVEGLSITTRDLERWADHPEARHHLPRLIRRLLWASVNPNELDFPDDVDQPGFDGVCRAEVGSPSCPSGTSFWELSVRKDVVDKLNEDYKSRSKGGAQGSPDALVLVTPRIFLKKRDWVAARQSERLWREVRVLDGQDVAAWLEQCPAVAAWFAGEHLGHAVHDLLPVVEYLRRWSQATHPPVPPSLVLTERPLETAQIIDWVAGEPSDLHVQAAARDEARVFVAAVLAELNGPTGDRWNSRTLVVETPGAWRSLVQRMERPLVLIPNFASDEPLDRGQHFACIPCEQVPHGVQAVSLAPIPWQEVARVLHTSGFDAAKAEMTARESRGHLSALRTLLGLPNLPAWSADPRFHTELAAMLLVGAWDPRVDGDCSTLRALGADPERVDEVCNRLCQTAGRPLEIKEGAYVWASQEAAWRGIHSLRTEKRLRSFGQVATAALGEDDPRYELPPDQRYVARPHGQHPPCSDVLRRALAESLLFLAHYNDPLRERLGRSIARQVVDDVVRALLTPAWKRWASLDNLLSVLAEAAPRVFLSCLRASLGSPDGVLRYFEEEGHPGLARATPHVPLLWALEVVAWEPATLSDVADCLAILAAHDPAGEAPAGRIANRPAVSLAAIFHRITPQTLASDEQRFTVLAALTQRRLDVGFRLLIHLMGQDLPSRRSCRPRLDERVAQGPVEPDPAQLESRSRRILDLLITTAGEDPDRWAELVRRSVDQVVDCVVDPSSASSLVTALLSRKENLQDPAASIWNEANYRLSSFRNKPERAPWAERAVERMRRVSDAFKPADPWLVFLRKFKALVLPEDFSGGIIQRIEAQEAVRVRALDETPPGDVGQRVTALLAELDEFRDLGRALARSVHAASFTEMLLEKRPCGPWAHFAAPFAAGYYYTHGQNLAWLRTLFLRWMESERTDDIVAVLLRISAEPKIWNLVDALGEPVESCYWARIELIGQHEGEQWDRACSELLAAGNLVVALECAGNQSAHISSENLLSTLERQNEETLHRVRQVAYRLANVFAELDRRVAEEQLDQLTRIALLELRYVAVLQRVRNVRYVRALFEGSPEFFAETAKLLTAGGRAASGAYKALSAWETYPGSDSADPQIWEPILCSWAARALELMGDTEFGVSQVAQVLARPVAGEDGHWPCEAARVLIESGRYPGLAEQLISAKYNLRGIVTYDPMKGSGVEDRALAQDFRHSAAAIRAHWPATAQGLDALVEFYEHQAEAGDEQARHERLAIGTPGTRRPPQG